MLIAGAHMCDRHPFARRVRKKNRKSHLIQFSNSNSRWNKYFQVSFEICNDRDAEAGVPNAINLWFWMSSFSAAHLSRCVCPSAKLHMQLQLDPFLSCSAITERQLRYKSGNGWCRRKKLKNVADVNESRHMNRNRRMSWAESIVDVAVRANRTWSSFLIKH